MALLSPINLHLSRSQQIQQGNNQLDEMRRRLLERSTTPAAQAELDRLNPAQNLQGLRPPTPQQPQQPIYPQTYQQPPVPAYQPQQPMYSQPYQQPPPMSQPYQQPQSQPPYQQMNGLNQIQPTDNNPYMLPSYYNQPMIGNMGGNQLLW